MKSKDNHFSSVYKDDIDGEELCSEILLLKDIHDANIKDKNIKPLTLLNKLVKLKLAALFPNVSIALRIFLTLPVTVASGERSFSKMAQVKNKFRNRTKQDRLVSLSMLAIEYKMARTINFESIIDTFAHSKARKVPL